MINVFDMNRETYKQMFFKAGKADLKETNCVQKPDMRCDDISLIDTEAPSPTPPSDTQHVSGDDWHGCDRGYHDNEDCVCAHNLKKWHPANKESFCICIPAVRLDDACQFIIMKM